jgi:hypothetical protein
MSKWVDILVNLRDVIQSSEEFKNISVYYDDAEMNPNVPLPAVSFKVGKKEVLNSKADCTEYQRKLTINLHTKTLDKRELQMELYEYEEQLVSVLNNARMNGIIPDFYDIVETGSSSIGALMFNARKEANQFNMIFFSNVLKVNFLIRYEI